MLTADVMARIHAAAFTQSRAWTEAEFASLLQSALVFASGDTRAFALVRVVAGEAELLTIATHPDHQRAGHAKRVMQEWEAEAKRRGATMAFLEVAADNPAARALYAGSGYLETGRRPGYYPRPDGPAADALLLTQDLTSG